MKKKKFTKKDILKFIQEQKASNKTNLYDDPNVSINTTTVPNADDPSLSGATCLSDYGGTITDITSQVVYLEYSTYSTEYTLDGKFICCSDGYYTNSSNPDYLTQIYAIGNDTVSWNPVNISATVSCLDPLSESYTGNIWTDFQTWIGNSGLWWDPFNCETKENFGGEISDPWCITNVDIFAPVEPILGCTDDTACNYDSTATEDDESCEYAATNADCDGNCLEGYSDFGTGCELIVEGCTDITYVEYNADANTDDGTCATPVVEGCTDSEAFNYDEDANVDNGSCIEVVYGCMDSTASNYDSAANTECTDPENQNSCAECAYPVLGCTNPSAANYNELATQDDGSCTGGGCTDITQVGFWQIQDYYEAGTLVGIPQTLTNLANDYGEGGNDIYTSLLAAFGLGEYATAEEIAVYDNLANFTFYKPYFFQNVYNCNDGWQTAVPGCGPGTTGEINNDTALNYNAAVNVTLTNYCMFGINGCTDTEACNYNSAATNDDDSCDYGTGTSDQPICEGDVGGCLDPAASNYNPDADYDNDSCEYTSGCMDDGTVTTDPLGNYTYADQRPALFIDGIAACNYDPYADIEDGSCEYTSCVGCGINVACNYDDCGVEEFDYNNDGIYQDTPCTVFDNSLCDFEECVGCMEMYSDGFSIVNYNYNWDNPPDTNISFLDVVVGIGTADAYIPEDAQGTEVPCCFNYGCRCQATSQTTCEGNAESPLEEGDVMNINYNVHPTTGEYTLFDCNCTDPTTQNTADGVPCVMCIAEIDGCDRDDSGPFPDVNGDCSDGTYVGTSGTCVDENGLNTGYYYMNYDPAANNNGLEGGEFDNCLEAVEGCTDEAANNHDPDANIDDGSCDYTEQEFCENENACNYIIAAGGITYDINNLDSNECNFECYGCNDENACNANQQYQEVDDEFLFEPCYNLDGEAMDCVTNNNQCINPCDIYDCSENTYDCEGNIADVYGCLDDADDVLNNDCECLDTAEEGGACIEWNTPPVDSTSCSDGVTVNIGCLYGLTAGCLHPNACSTGTPGIPGTPGGFNTDADADCEGNEVASDYDWGTLTQAQIACCDFTSCQGCTDPDSPDYDSEATQDNGNCTPGIFGCGNQGAINYDCAIDDNGELNEPLTGEVTCNDGVNMPDDAYCIFSCDPTGLGENPCSWGCTDPTADNYDEEADIDDGSCVTEIPGCMDSSACNYNSSANIDDNSCTFAEYWCGTTYQCSEDSCPPIEGCMDTTACNYMSVATIEPEGACQYAGDPGIGVTCWDGSVVCFSNLCPVEPIEGCMDPNAFNYNPDANTEGEDCKYCKRTTAIQCDPEIYYTYQEERIIDCLVIEGETPNINDAYLDSGIIVPDGPGIEDWDDVPVASEIEGCMDPEACNYNEAAQVEAPNACDYESCVGCMDDGYYMQEGGGFEPPFPTQPADNYDPTATIPCSEESGGFVYENTCCTYDSLQGDEPTSIQCNWCPIEFYPDAWPNGDPDYFGYNPPFSNLGYLSGGIMGGYWYPVPLPNGYLFTDFGQEVSQAIQDAGVGYLFWNGNPTTYTQDCMANAGGNSYQSYIFNQQEGNLPQMNCPEGMNCMEEAGAFNDICAEYGGGSYTGPGTTFDGVPIIWGCTDPDADNYNPDATNDDGSCGDTGFNLLSNCEEMCQDWDEVPFINIIDENKETLLEDDEPNPNSCNDYGACLEGCLENLGQNANNWCIYTEVPDPDDTQTSDSSMAAIDNDEATSLIKEQDRGIRKQKVGNSGDVVPINQKIKDKIKTKLSRPDRGTSKDTYLNATWRIIDIEEPPTFNYVNKPLSTCPQGDGSQNILEPPRDIVPSGDVADFPDDDTDFNLNTGGPERPITPTRQ